MAGTKDLSRPGIKLPFGRVRTAETYFGTRQGDIDCDVSTFTVVTLRFEGGGTLTPLIVDGSSSETPLQFALREGQYQVSATVRESPVGAGNTRVKTLTAGAETCCRSLFAYPQTVLGKFSSQSEDSLGKPAS